MNIINKIQNYLNKREYKKAIELGENYLDSSKNKTFDEQLFLILGWTYDQSALNLKNANKKAEYQKKAISFFKKALPTNKFSALRGIGTVYHHRYESEKALAYYRQALKLRPGNPDSFNDIGNAIRRLAKNIKNKKEQKKLQFKAARYYKKSLELGNQDTFSKCIVFYNLIFFYNEIGEFSEARKYAQKYIKLLSSIKNTTQKRFLIKNLDVIKRIIDKSED